jgi:hypothetical protein
MDRLDNANWRKATASESANGCVEVGCTSGVTVVRDTKNRAGAVLGFNRHAWRHFLARAAKDGFKPV